MEGCDTVFHLAAMPGLMKSWSDFALYNTCNLDATQRLLEAARDTRPAQFIHISTSSVYGKEATQGEDAPSPTLLALRHHQAGRGKPVPRL
jgi:UDP-glucuronate 4-epimerase